MKLSTRTWLAVFVAIGLLLRLGLAIRLGLNEPPRPGSDQYEFDTYAWNLAQGNGYRGLSPNVTDQNHLTAYRPPGVSAVWAGLYVVLGHRYDAVRITHCLVGALTILVVYAIGKRVFDQNVGLIAAGVFAVWPQSLLYSVGLQSEPLGTLSFLWALLECLRFAETLGWRRALGAGLLLGYSILCRPAGFFMLPLVCIWVVWQFRHDLKSLRQACLIPIAAILPFIPWTVRNYLVLGELVPISTAGGSALLQGNNRIVATDPKYYGYCVWDTSIPEYREAIQAPNNEVERDRVAKRLAVEWLKGNPDKWLYLLQAKFRRSWTPILQQPSRLNRLVMLATWGPVLILFAAAYFPTLFLLLRGRHPGWLIHLAILHYQVNSLVFYGSARYRYSIEGLCIILAAVAALWIWHPCWRSQDEPRQPN